MKVYEIKSGCHYSKHWIPKLHIERIISHTVTFTESCKYNGSIQLNEQVNKLFGISKFPFHPHLNSIRYGWRYENRHDVIYIYKYEYSYGKRIVEFVYEVEINKPIFLTLNIPYTGFELRPYFGGLEAAPHDIKIIFD